MQDNNIVSLVQRLKTLWSKIESLKTSDPFQAQCLYEKYKALDTELAAELPPPLPSMIVEDQAVS